MVAAVVSTEAAKVMAKGRTLCHMRKYDARRGLLLLHVLDYGRDNLVQRALGSVAEAIVSLAEVRDSVFHVFEALTVGLRIRYVSNETP